MSEVKVHRDYWGGMVYELNDRFYPFMSMEPEIYLIEEIIDSPDYYCSHYRDDIEDYRITKLIATYNKHSGLVKL